MRDDKEIQLPGPPSLRRAVGFLVLLTAVGLMTGMLPWGPGSVGVALLLVAAGLLA